MASLITNLQLIPRMEKYVLRNAKCNA